MKIRKVKVGIKSVDALLNDFVKTCESLQDGKEVKQEKGVYFTSIDSFRKAITPKRFELLKAIKQNNPSSIRHLSTIIDRNIKNVSDDIRFLEQVGLIDLKNSNDETKIIPFVNYDKIIFEIAV